MYYVNREQIARRFDAIPKLLKGSGRLYRPGMVVWYREWCRNAVCIFAIEIVTDVGVISLMVSS